MCKATFLCAWSLCGCAKIWVCVCVCVLCSVWLQQRQCVVAKWTSVNKLGADCIYLIHMLVNYTAVCGLWYVWEEKSPHRYRPVSEVKSLWPSQLKCHCLFWKGSRIYYSKQQTRIINGMGGSNVTNVHGLDKVTTEMSVPTVELIIEVFFEGGEHQTRVRMTLCGGRHCYCCPMF